MDMLDRLERLARLRETGALTEAEFQAAKAQLLAGGAAPAPAPARAPAATRTPPRASAAFEPEPASRPIWPWLAGAAGLLVVVLLIGLLVGRDVGGAAAGNFTAVPDNVAVANEAAVDEPVPTPTPTPADYAFASGAGVIGMSAEALEARLGPAESKAGGIWEYHVGGCPIDYSVRHDAVEAATMAVNAACHPVVGDRPITEATTMGSLAGTYRADCVANCRGPGDPVLTKATRDATYVAVDAPLDAWAAALRDDDGADPEADDADRYTCVADPPADVAAQFASLPVSSVTIGRAPGACRR